MPGVLRYAVRVFEDGVDPPPEGVEEFFAESLPGSRKGLGVDRPDRDAWRTLFACAIASDGRVLGGIHMDIGPVTFGPLGGDTEAILEWVEVEPGHRRMGIGTALMTAALERARAAGCRHVRCNVSWNSPGEIALFRKCGFALPCLDDGEYFVVKPLQAG